MNFVSDTTIQPARTAAALQPVAVQPAVVQPVAAVATQATAPAAAQASTPAASPLAQRAATAAADPGPVALQAGTGVHTMEDTMAWIEGQMSRPRVAASSGQSQQLSELHSRLLDAHKQMMSIWTSSS